MSLNGEQSVLKCVFVLWVTPVDVDKRLQESDTRDWLAGWEPTHRNPTETHHREKIERLWIEVCVCACVSQRLHFKQDCGLKEVKEAKGLFFSHLLNQGKIHIYEGIKQVKQKKDETTINLVPKRLNQDLLEVKWHLMARLVCRGWWP